MANMTNYLEKKLLDHTLGLLSFTMPVTAYLGLSSSDPTDTGSLAGEPVGNGYARQDVTTAMGVTHATSGVSTNEDTILFGPCTTTAWGAVAYGIISDALTAGNTLLHGALSSSRNIVVNDTMEFSPSTFTITFG